MKVSKLQISLLSSLGLLALLLTSTVFASILQNGTDQLVAVANGGPGYHFLLKGDCIGVVGKSCRWIVEGSDKDYTTQPHEFVIYTGKNFVTEPYGPSNCNGGKVQWISHCSAS